MRVLVTGGSGFIGTRLTKRLVQEGYQVIVVDLKEPKVNGVEYHQCDIRDVDSLATAFGFQPESVLHLAAMTSVLNSIKIPQEVFDVNVKGTQVLLEHARIHGCTSFVFASTNAVVGQSDSKISENSPSHPLTPYGASKAAAESLLSAYGSCYGMASTSLRLTNVYGPEMWQKDSIVPRLFRFATGSGKFAIYGDGEQYRDYVFVDDVASAFIKALRSDDSGVHPIGSGESISVNKLVQLVSNVTKKELQPVHIDAQSGEMRGVDVDLSGTEKWGFTPDVMIADGIATTWQDFLSAQ